jgi:hypothetical protein
VTRRPFVALGLAVLASGCVAPVGARSEPGTCDERTPAPGLPFHKRDSITVDLDGNWPDAGWARIARTVPGGFAGIYFEHPDSVPADVQRVDGHPVRQRTIVRLVHPEQRVEAMRALRGALKAVHRSPGFDLAGPLIVRARWDFAQLFDWYRYLLPHVHTIPGVYMSDINESENRIVVGAITPEVERQVLRRVRELGAPCTLVRTEYAGPVRIDDEPLRRPRE